MTEEKSLKYRNRLLLKNKIGRLAWNAACFLLFRPFSGALWMPWQKFLLQLFGARLGQGAQVHASVKIWAPWNLKMGRYACLAQGVDCYNVAPISIGDHATVSQRAYLCTASHDIGAHDHHLVTAPIEISARAWVAAEAFVGMGVTVGEGAVAGARAAVFKDVEPWTVVGGNPARFLKKRVINDHD